MPSYSIRIASAIFLILVGCGNPVNSGGGGGDGTGGAAKLEFIFGSPPSDTVLTRPLEEVIVELRDAGGDPIPNALIEFDGQRDSNRALPWISLTTLEGAITEIVLDTTDANGRAGALVLRGSITGTEWLRVTALEHLVKDSIPFVILPGAPAQISILPADTAVLVGGSFDMQGLVEDQFGNIRIEVASIVAESSAVSIVTQDGMATVTGEDFGRASVRATGAGLSAQAWISVVPDGELAVHVVARSTDDSIHLATVRTDGSEFQKIYSSSHFVSRDWTLEWISGGQNLVFHMTSHPDPARLFRPGPGGSLPLFIAQDYGGFPESTPRYGVDGWVYYSLTIDPTEGTQELWRVRADGTDPEPVGLPATSRISDLYPDLSPNGQLLVFSTNRVGTADRPLKLAILDLNSLTIQHIDVEGLSPIWSPDGSRLAFIDPDEGTINVIAPDGSSLRVITQIRDRYSAWIDWSNDGRWIVAASTDGIDIIDPDQNMILPLSFGRWSQPAWRP